MRQGPPRTSHRKGAHSEAQLDRVKNEHRTGTFQSSPFCFQIAEEELARRPSASAMETLQRTLAIQTPYWETLRTNPDTALLSHLEAWERERDRDGRRRLLAVGWELANFRSRIHFIYILVEKPARVPSYPRRITTQPLRGPSNTYLG